ncbi:uncharacterized protein DS421_12g357150 [Arachis hypogaea]|nr:uncharacterized protein DS421_12g357150 [Arachis hypogaea]
MHTPRSHSLFECLRITIYVHNNRNLVCYRISSSFYQKGDSLRRNKIWTQVLFFSYSQALPWFNQLFVA